MTQWLVIVLWKPFTSPILDFFENKKFGDALQ